MKVVFDRCCHTATKFSVSIKEDQERLPTIYWLLKLHKRPYKARFIANSNSCTYRALKIINIMPHCYKKKKKKEKKKEQQQQKTKKHLIKYCEKVYERSGKKTPVRYWIN